MTRRLLLACVLVVASAGAGAASVIWFTPLREVRVQSYQDTVGQLSGRYSWRFVADDRATGTCVLVLTDVQTGQFAIATVPVEACQ